MNWGFMLLYGLHEPYEERRSMRADARRNRELIVAAALEAFTERGADASMEEIARSAGLSVGTLYRHFPDRQALLHHIAVDALDDLLAFSRAAAAEPDQTRWQVLLRVVDHCAGLPLALTKSLSEATEPNPRVAGLAAESNTLFEELAHGAQQEGTMRPDIPPSEIIGVLNVAICRPDARADDPLTTVLLDGLHT
ncbi:TetR/AcrR family transcriptional regulator [Streptomyces sp. 150FB]|uniref:TetR/AcrR family transcriptional regulator n=1 Tax=Streptomyces sp. 150FB TaxID=1576605 RepID=UPI00191C4FD6|nr:TetR/AcrR family transcriptional regulator [Streptomyces sp. 150FB]